MATRLKIATVEGTQTLTNKTLTTAVLGSSTATTQSPADNSTKVATTAYVDSAVLGQNFKEAARVATTGNLVGTYLLGVFTYTATGTNDIDGVTLALNDRVLVKNQSNNPDNGIYKVTTAGALGVAGVLTRGTDADQSTDFKTGDSLFITAGTTLATTTWAYTGIDNPTLGSDAITFVQTAGQGSLTSGNGITITGNSIAINTSVTADLSTAQTFTNKTLTSPKINEDVVLTPTATELNYVDGVTSAIQTQLNAKAASLGADDNYVTDAEKTVIGNTSGTNTGDASGHTALAPKDSPVFTTAVTLPIALTGVIRADSGVVSVDTDVTDIVAAASATAAGKVELATDAEVNTGTDTARAVTPANIEAWTGSAQITTVGTLASPVLTTPNIGTPSAGVLTNATGLPAAAVVAGTLTGAFTLSGTTSFNLLIPTSDHTATGNITNSFQSGATIDLGNLVMMGSSSKWILVDADGVATCAGLIGIALEAKNDTQAMLVALPGSFVRDDTWNWTPGATLYASETAGGIATAIPTGADGIIKVIGFAMTADVIFFNPSPDQQSIVA